MTHQGFAGLEFAHVMLWGRLQGMRETLQKMTMEAVSKGDDEGRQACLFMDAIVAKIPISSDWDELWDTVEPVGSQAVALAAATAGIQPRASAVFTRAAEMLGRMLQHDKSEEEVALLVKQAIDEQS